MSDKKVITPADMIPPKVELLMNGMYMFMGDVSMETMSPVIDWILAENMKKIIKQKN